MKKFLLPFLCLISASFAETPKPKTPPPQGEELFNKDQAAILVSGEFLYWHVLEGSLDYAIRMKGRSWGPSPSYAQGDMERAEFDWDPGYRVSLGYYRAPNFWEAVGEFTYINLDGSDQVKTPPTSESRFLTGTFPQIFPGPMSHAKSDIYLHYKLANLSVNRVFHPPNNPHLRLRLSGGLTALFANQLWRVRYYDFTDNVTAMKNRWRYWGIGMRMGIGVDWFWGADFYLTGKFSVALVAGHYRNRAKQETSFMQLPGDNTAIPVRNVSLKDYRMSFNSQFLLGPSYQKSFTNWRLEVFAGYELNSWTNLQEIYRSTASTSMEAKETWKSPGQLALHGLTTRLTINF